MPKLDRIDAVFLLNLGDDENRFNPAWLSSLNALLDEVQADPGAPLVTTASGKFFSNGLDLDWFAANAEQVPAFVVELHALLARLLTFPAPTVAALQGHTFAAGAMLALTHDFRVMRSGRGFFCLPEVDIRIPFTPGMSALIRARLLPQTAHEAMTTGRRYGGEEAERAGIVNRTASEDLLLEAALEIARPLTGKDPHTLATIKQRLYSEAVATLLDRTAVGFGAETG